MILRMLKLLYKEVSQLNIGVRNTNYVITMLLMIIFCSKIGKPKKINLPHSLLDGSYRPQMMKIQ